ncbi:MAG: hypothetical protein L3J13_01940 [Devosiaceae bacterium]|nr:hypothetical protein [Devosiaceae bacterium]
MNVSVLRVIIRAFLVVGLLSQTHLALAKVKTTEGSKQNAITWLDKSQVAALLSEGAFWCMEPEGTTCSFSAKVSFSDGTNFTYLVISMWDEGILFKEYYDSYVRDNGTLCEPAILNFDRMGWTDLNGVPVNAEVMELYTGELKEWFGADEKPDRCFRYGYSEPGNPRSLTQYSVSDTGEPIDPIPFLVDFSASDAGVYSLRVENDI